MRKVLLSLLLASVAASPALGQRSEDSPDQSEARVRPSPPPERERPRPQQRSEERRPERLSSSFGAAPARERSQNARDFDAQPKRVREQTFDRRETQQHGSGNLNARGRPTLPSAEARGARPAQWREREASGDSVAQWRQGERSQWRGDRPGAFSPGERFQRTVPPVGARPELPAPAPQVAQHRSGFPQWRDGWRHDRRYDWRDHRRRNSSLFHIGIYLDPFGWNYHRYRAGWRLWPSYYHRSYWLSDPWSYRLPHAPWPYQWVRYWDDAVLVNTVTGQIVDIEYNFFW